MTRWFAGVGAISTEGANLNVRATIERKWRVERSRDRSAARSAYVAPSKRKPPRGNFYRTEMARENGPRKISVAPF